MRPVAPGDPAGIVTSDRRRGRLLIGLVFGIVWGLITHGTFAGSGDEPHYTMIAHSIAFDGDLDLANNYAEARLIGGGTLEPGAHAIERNGRLRPVHDIGMPLALAPVVRLAYVAAETLGDTLPASFLDSARLNKSLLLRHQLSLIMALLTGLLAREVFLLTRGLGGTPRLAFGSALLFALTPPVLSHSFLFFTEIPTALITIFVFRRVSGNTAARERMILLLGALTGYLLLVHARNVGLVAGLAVVSALTLGRRPHSTRLLTLFAVALATAALARVVTTYQLWGTLATTPHAALGAAGGAADTVREVFARGTGLLFDREFGLLAYAPVYLLAGPGLIALFRSRQILARDLSIVAACYVLPILLPMTNVHGWTGGWSPAARFLVPVAPLLWVCVYACAIHSSRTGQAIVGALAAYQLAIGLFVWQFPKTLWNDGDGVSAFSWTRWLPSWTEQGAAPVFAVALVLALAFTLVYASRSSRLTSNNG